MKKLTLFLLLMLPILLLAQTKPLSQSVTQPEIAITRVTVIDVERGERLPNRTVLLRGDRIVAVEQAAKARVPKGTRVVDGAGKYLIPGLWDMHTHLAREANLTMLVACGVTGARVMQGMPRILEFKQRIARGELIGPTLVTAGPIVEGPPPPGRETFGLYTKTIVTTAEEGARAVREQKAAGYDFIKVYDLLSREAYEAVVAEAKRQGLPVAGHVPYDVGLGAVLAAGQKSIEHLTGYPEMLLPKDAPQQARQGDRMTVWNLTNPSQMSALARETRAARVWNTPTLMTRLIQESPEAVERYLASPQAAYLSPSQRDSTRNRRWLSKWTAEDFRLAAERRAKQDRMIRALRDAGAGLLAGTDKVPFGPTLHYELQYLVAAGLTPAEALRAATLNPARFLGKMDSTGTVQAGRRADLVLLDADPLADIGNTWRISAVVVGGQLLDRAKLDQMVKTATEAMQQPPPNQTLGELISPTPANFAGTWVLDTQKSTGLSPALMNAESVTWVVTWDDNQIIVLPKVAGAKNPIADQGAFGAPKATYNLDGSETTFEVTEPPRKFTHKAKWTDGGKILELNQALTRDSGVITTVLRCELAADGKTLAVHQRLSNYPLRVKLILNKK